MYYTCSGETWSNLNPHSQQLWGQDPQSSSGTTKPLLSAVTENKYINIYVQVNCWSLWMYPWAVTAHLFWALACYEQLHCSFSAAAADLIFFINLHCPRWSDSKLLNKKEQTCCTHRHVRLQTSGIIGQGIIRQHNSFLSLSLRPSLSPSADSVFQESCGCALWQRVSTSSCSSWVGPWWSWSCVPASASWTSWSSVPSPPCALPCQVPLMK